ncbi:hypothetical protein EUX98_g5284 [Antrodiella citrinella]|uniref:Uncharacterized protein n=1 Tax=Antrodiella citrinella TaxID=2447956 RepID=A0A4S4MS44_9APHY|nr:hypothetical protein EUX98_g5284 [Antrodiella citrinella]
MKDRLETEADFLQFAALDLASDLESDEEDILTPDGLLTEQYVTSDASLHYVPTALADRLTPAFLHGYIVVMQTVLQILLEDFSSGDGKCVPTVAKVAKRVEDILAGRAKSFASSEGSEAREQAEEQEQAKGKEESDEAADIAVLKTYIDAGGKVEYALDAITDCAYEKSPVGGQYRRHLHIREEDADFAKEVGNLPECANDLAFKLVRAKLGLPEEGMGPHWIFLSDDEDEDEVDEDTLYEGTGKKADAS